MRYMVEGGNVTGLKIKKTKVFRKIKSIALEIEYYYGKIVVAFEGTMQELSAFLGFKEERPENAIGRRVTLEFSAPNGMPRKLTNIMADYSWKSGYRVIPKEEIYYGKDRY